jgi:hypothetical protein
VPLAAAKPAWLTAELEMRVIDQGIVQAPPDAPFPGEIGIRPGSWMISPAGCTMNYVFLKGDSLGIGTAGHCVDKVGDHVILLTLAPTGTSIPTCHIVPCSGPVLVDIGQVVARHDNGIGDDFALVEIRPELHPWVSPTTAVIGGPCGAYPDAGLVQVTNPLGERKTRLFRPGVRIGPSTFGPETVWHYGHGIAIGTGGTPREGVAWIWEDDAYFWDSPAIFGDSGSPVRVTDLRAVGNLTHLVISTRTLPALIAGTRITKMFQIASGWSLENSELCP